MLKGHASAFLRGGGRPPGKYALLVWNNSSAAVAAAHGVDPDRWQTAFGAVIDRIAPRFARYEPVRHAAGLMLGMLSGLDRKNCWTIAEHRGEVTPDGLQHLLCRAKWDADAVRDDVRGYLVEHFGDPDAVLVLDETGDVKKGVHSVGVQRQYTGTAGRVENAQVAVFCAYAAERGHALIDRAWYLPRSWTTEPDRCAAAGIPADTAFSTKPALATAMITRAVRAGVPAAWVAGDEVYGADPGLRRTIRADTDSATYRRSRPTTAYPPTPGRSQSPNYPRCSPTQPGRPTRPGRAAKDPATTRGHGSPSKPKTTPNPATPGSTTYSSAATTPPVKLAYHRCYTPHPVTLRTLVRVAGQRWRIEESFQAAKGLTGLDQHQVRRWTSWHRWTTLAMLAHAFLAVATAAERDHTGTPAGLIALTVNEFRRLFDALILSTRRTLATPLAWSTWRRRHQARARECHYRRREHQ